ncbi:diguanylate cyclase (GGDEF)-like protein [Paenochrobactrum gallinarii]|uniref:diguanylate cyclase n=1 Tax=Paenochrobactrum gallinarii TaxID=643673 RepID=A0A841LU25_9HYPH|nr:GGDEF domain-containing protein [Paenochrobactrum gallinarii]MBB6260052.1 diguanylate cyclase (GGDEF)-like protein [Paenochrobactrum gallinarii]
MRLPSAYVWKRTVVVVLIAAIASISLSTVIRMISGTSSDATTIVVRLILPFLIATPIGVFWFSRLEQLEESYRNAVRQANELARIANVDPLTGLLNRRSFIEQFKVVTKAGVRGWFLIADIDYLKDINDQYGHPVGDDAVVSVAEAMIDILPDDCLIARIGGDEFCAFVPKASCLSIDSAVSLISDLAGNLLENKRPVVKQKLSVSVGYITVKNGQSFEDVMSLSDEKLYRKKNQREIKSLPAE